MNYYIPEIWYQIWIGLILVGMVITAILFARYRRKQEKIISLQDDKIRQLTSYIHELDEQKKAAKDLELHTTTTNHPIVTLSASRYIDHDILTSGTFDRPEAKAEIGKSILIDICESKDLMRCIDWCYEEDIKRFGMVMRGTLMVIDPLGGFSRNE